MQVKGSMFILTLALLLAAGLLLIGCELQGKDEGAQLPTRGYGTFKMHIESVGPVAERDESGNHTGRRGFDFDEDQDGASENFYQITKPSGGIIALSFDMETGFANGGLPVAMAPFTPATDDYEIPLESLTTWIKIDQIIGYRKAYHVDEPEILVYEDRVNNEQLEAPMTGGHQTFDMYLASLAVVDPTELGTSSMGGGEPVADPGDAQDGDGDFSPAALGDPAEDCDKWGDLCNFEKACGFFTSGWSVRDCQQKFYGLSADAHTVRYYSCVKGCRGAGCGGFQECQRQCQVDELPDAYGCSGQYGPEITDVIYVVRRGGQVYRVDQGFNLLDGDQLAIFVEYIDVEGDFGGGQMVVSFGGDEKTLNVPARIGRSSFDDKAYLGFTVASPLPAGDYSFTIHLVDKGCENIGGEVEGGFRSEGQRQEIGGQIGGAKMSFEMFEVYDTGLNKFNLGRGFVDVRSIQLVPNTNFLYELMQFDVAIIQAYVWTFSNTDKFTGLSWDTINKLIFTTTHDTRGTKWDETDDIQSMAFYIDQPMSSGLFTFYGDEGWNIYPVGPYGDNEDQPFMRGDFESTRVKVPFHPIYQVSTDFTGCNDTCAYWIDYIYNDARNSIRGFATAEEAQAACEANSADKFWRGLFFCYKKAKAELNGCVSLDDCIGDLPDPGNAGPLCNYAENIPLMMRVHIDPSYVASDIYGDIITGGDRPLRVGVVAQNPDTGAWMPLPGGYADFQYGKTDYLISLPYAPLTPQDFIQINSANSAMQSQMYLALFDYNPETDLVLPYGTGFYPSADIVMNEGDWFYLLVYTWNWADPEQEGWTLGVVTGNTIYGWVNPYETIIDVNFGDLRATGGTILQP